MARSPYTGRRPATASAPPVDEQRLVARYEQVGNQAQCAREFGLSTRRVRGILVRNGVLIPAGQETTAASARAIPDRRPVSRLGAVPEFSNKTRARKAAQRRLAREPSPADLLFPAEAARIAGTDTAALQAAAGAGRLRNHGSRYFPRYRRDEVRKLRDLLRESADAGGKEAPAGFGQGLRPAPT